MPLSRDNITRRSDWIGYIDEGDTGNIWYDLMHFGGENIMHGIYIYIYIYLYIHKLGNGILEERKKHSYIIFGRAMDHAYKAAQYEGLDVFI